MKNRKQPLAAEEAKEISQRLFSSVRPLPGEPQKDQSGFSAKPPPAGTSTERQGHYKALECTADHPQQDNEQE